MSIPEVQSFIGELHPVGKGEIEPYHNDYGHSLRTLTAAVKYFDPKDQRRIQIEGIKLLIRDFGPNIVKSLQGNLLVVASEEGFLPSNS